MIGAKKNRFTHVCDTDDDAAVARFRDALRVLGVQVVEQGWGMGVDVYRCRLRGRDITIYSDAWTIDVEGPDDVVVALLLASSKNAA